MWPLYHEVSFNTIFPPSLQSLGFFQSKHYKAQVAICENLHGTLSENYIHAPFFLFITSVPTEPFCPRPLCYMGTLSLTNIT